MVVSLATLQQARTFQPNNAYGWLYVLNLLIKYWNFVVVYVTIPCFLFPPALIFARPVNKEEITIIFDSFVAITLIA